MSIHPIRLVNILFALLIFTFGSWNYLWYLAAMHISLEVLNHRKIYLQHSYKIYNLIFWAYSLVLLGRMRTMHFSEVTEWMINSAEHLFFGIIICLKIYIYTAVFSKAGAYSRWGRALVAVVIFNLVGLFNEVFQNWLGKRSLFVFIPDSIKDIKMNLLGAGIFLLAVMIRFFYLERKP